MVLERLRLDGPPRKVVIVTGGGRGLGKAMAISLAEAGADVCIASRTVSQLESAAAEIAAAGGRRPLIVPTNVQKREECDALIEKTVAHFGRLDVMLNNAGIGDRRGAGDRIQDLEDADWHDTIEVNLHSAFYCSRAATRQFLKQGGGGVIVNVASGTALRSSPQSLGYAAAKAGIVHVIGTTGLSAQDEAAIREAAKKAVIVKSGNMSLGVNLLAALVKRVAKTLDDEFDIEECRRAMQAYCREVVLIQNPYGRDGLAKRLLQLRSETRWHSIWKLLIAALGWADIDKRAGGHAAKCFDRRCAPMVGQYDISMRHAHSAIAGELHIRWHIRRKAQRCR